MLEKILLLLAPTGEAHLGHAVHLFYFLLKLFGFVKRNIGDHDLGGTVGDEFLFHQIDSRPRLGRFCQISRNIVFHLDPTTGHCAKKNRDTIDQKEQHPFIYNKRCNLHHKPRPVSSGAMFFFHLSSAFGIIFIENDFCSLL